MANISTLTVSLVAETAKFENGLKRARQQSQGFGVAVAKAMRGAAVATTVLTTGLSVLVRQSLKVVDQQTKMAQRLGLSQRALAGLTLAGEQTGSSQRNLQLALQRSTRRIAEAAQGTGEAQKALRELNLDARALAQLSPEKQFAEIAGAMATIPNQSDKIRLGFKLFDSEGVGLINTLALGKEGIEAFIVEAERLGAGLTDRQTKAIEDTNDAINLMRTAFRGLGNQLASTFAPAITATADAITSITARVTDSIPKWVAWASSIFGVERALDSLTIKELTAEIEQVDKDLLDAQGTLRGFQIQLEQSSGLNFSAQAGIEGAQAEVDRLTQRYNDLIRARSELRKQGEVSADIPTLGGEGGGTDPLFQARDRVTVGTSIVARELEKNMALFDQWEARAVKAFEATRTPAEALRLKMEDIRLQLAENPFFDKELAAREAQDAVDAYLLQMDRLKTDTDKTATAVNEFWRRAFESMQQNLSDTLVTGFSQGTKKMADRFRDMLKQMVADLIASKLLTFFRGALGDLFPGLGIPIPSNPGSQLGSPVRAGQTRTTGERGVELFTPSASGSIRPLGAVTIQQELNFNGGGFDAATLIPILEANNMKLKAELLDEFDRGAFA